MTSCGSIKRSISGGFRIEQKNKLFDIKRFLSSGVDVTKPKR
jgi:hypothetical protein